MQTIVLGGFKDDSEMIIVYFKTNSICYDYHYLHLYINLCFIISNSILLIKDHWNHIGLKQLAFNGHDII